MNMIESGSRLLTKLCLSNTTQLLKILTDYSFLIEYMFYNQHTVFPQTFWLIGKCPNVFKTIVPKAVKMLLYPKFSINPVLKYIKCHIFPY